MGKEKKEIEFNKETDDVMVLVIELVKDIKAKKPLAQLGAENLANLMTAIQGVDQIPAEAKDKLVEMQTVGYRMGELISAITDAPPAA